MSLLRLDPYTGQVTTHAPPSYLEDNSKILLSAQEWDGKFSTSSVEEEEIHTWVLDNDELAVLQQGKRKCGLEVNLELKIYSRLICSRKR